MSETIKVVVRVRPMNTKELDRGCKSILHPDPSGSQITIQKPDDKQNSKSFGFDYVFNTSSPQNLIYQKTAFQLVENVIEGYNGTIFAYGQTGCGKTHSMVGVLGDEELRGIIPRTFNHILGVVRETEKKEFLIRCSFIEIYNEEVRDLLGKDPKGRLDLKETPEKGVFIKDLSMNTAKTYDDMMEYMNMGNKNRSVGETLMNKDSSRSHSIFTIYVEVGEKFGDGVEDRIVAGKLNLVDLAGSQRISKTGAAGDRLKEAQKINLSLSALGNVISALVDGKAQHIPYRDSKLTRLLQDSLGGNTKTVMIANCSPADYNYDETLSTLRYASRAKFIKNKPVINEDPKDALLKEYQQQIKELRMMLENGGGGGGVNSNPNCNNVTGGHNNNGNNVSEMEIKKKLDAKEQQLTNEKNERKRLEQRIRSLEEQHIKAEDIKISDKMINEIHKFRQGITHDKENPGGIEKGEDDLEPTKNMLESEQIERYKKLYKKGKLKVRQLESEIRDLNKEHYTEKQLLLDEVREEGKENSLLSAILAMVLSKEEIEVVRNTAVYQEEKGEYRVTPFYLRNKKVVFPKLQENASKDFLVNEIEQRELTFENKTNTSLQIQSKGSKSYNQSSTRSLDRGEDENLILNTIIKNAKMVNLGEEEGDRVGDKEKEREKATKREKVQVGILEPIRNLKPPLQQGYHGESPARMVRKGQLQPL